MYVQSNEYIRVQIGTVSRSSVVYKSGSGLFNGEFNDLLIVWSLLQKTQTELYPEYKKGYCYSYLRTRNHF